ncbi:MAG: glycosyltransferase family 2 protein [Clostridia bacterium]|nr:glycosyltransferase family 2 protein [Clostridia bacterium]
MEIFKQVLDIINYVFMAILGVGFLPQIIYVLLFFLKPKKYKKAETCHKVAIFIPARNESATIFNTVKSMFRQNYPADKFTVYVVADNCTDNTAELAREAGATVFERFDDERRSRGWALDYGTRLALEQDPDIEFFVMFDADNVAHPDYLSKMNDAFESGVEFARGYSNSKNIDQNVTTAISGIYYLRDSRMCCQSRSALGLDQQLMGPGMMISAEFIKEKGFDAHSISEDAEFTYNRMLEGKRTKYVDEAVYYEEQPTTMKDVFNRNIRFGYGLNKLFFNHGFRMLGKFFTTGRLSFVDMFLQLMFIPIAMICCIWIPIYYGFTLIESIVMLSTDPNMLYVCLTLAGIAIS